MKSKRPPVPLPQAVKTLFSEYVRKGGKENRKLQRDRMIAFARLAQERGAKHIDQVGAKHVIAYWKHCRALRRSDKTMTDHWYALRTLWFLAGKSGLPPKPKLKGGMGAVAPMQNRISNSESEMNHDAEQSL